MATSHVTGIVALMRSVEPMSHSNVVRQILFDTASDAGCAAGQGLSRLDVNDPHVQPKSSITNPGDTRCRSMERGHGVPSARRAVERLRDSANPELLTPLFSFKSSANKYFYTVVPQMGRAAIRDTLLPKGSGPRNYAPVGTLVLAHTRGYRVYYSIPSPARRT